MWRVYSCLKFFNDYITHWLVFKLLCLSFSMFWPLIVSPTLFLTIVHFKLYWYLNFLLYSAHTKLFHTFISICAYAFYFYFLPFMFVFLLWPNFCSSVKIEFRCHLLCQVFFVCQIVTLLVFSIAFLYRALIVCWNCMLTCLSHFTLKWHYVILCLSLFIFHILI